MEKNFSLFAILLLMITGTVTYAGEKTFKDPRVPSMELNSEGRVTGAGLIRQRIRVTAASGHDFCESISLERYFDNVQYNFSGMKSAKVGCLENYRGWMDYAISVPPKSRDDLPPNGTIYLARFWQFQRVLSTSMCEPYYTEITCE